MQFITLKQKLKNFIIFSLQDIRKLEAGFDLRRLSEWQKKGYIKMIRKGFYIFSDLEINESALFSIANKIYHPSYVSLESALNYYNLIPEGVFTITSVSSRKTYKFKTQVASFSYHKLKPELFFGYNVIKMDNLKFKIADMEKALLDYFYFNSDMRTMDDIKSLRLNVDILQQLDKSKIKAYLELFDNQQLSQRIKKLLTFIQDAKS